jgi:hypothetical protein
MKVDFTRKLVTLAGENIKYATKDQTTLMDVSLDALLTPMQDEQNLSGEEKAKRYVLATRIYSNKTDVDLETDEISLIKRLIGKLFGPLIVGQAYPMLENK